MIIRRTVALSFVALSLLGCGGGGSAESSAPPPQSSSSGGESYSLADFTVLVTQQAAPELCNAPDAPLRACFQVDAAQCTELFGIAMTQCAHALEGQLPAVVDVSNSEAVGAQIAQCAGQAYGVGLTQQGLHLATPGCQ
jgi:hypothetical protein